VKVLITGALGQLGYHLVISAPQDAAVTAVDIDDLDLTDSSGVCAFVKKIKPDIIINTAAYTAVDKAEDQKESAFAVNSGGAYNLAVAAKDVSARLIHISTDYVFDGTNYRPYRYDAPAKPLGVYGRSKFEGENRIQSVLPDSSLILRTAWLYSGRGNNFLKTMLSLMASGKLFSVVADQIGTPTSAITLADAVWRFAGKAELSGVYHFTDNGVASWYDFAVAIMEESLSLGLLSTEIEIKPAATADYPTPAKRPFYSVLDKSKTFADIAIQGVHWRKALREVLSGIELET